MNDSPLVSVVVATYNMGRYLASSVTSILAQTYRNVEVIVVDDGSSDNTPEVLETLARDSRVRFRRQANRGQAAAKNAGVREAAGDLVAFLDADDMWAPHKLEVQVPLLVRSIALGVVYSRLLYIDEKAEPIRVSDNELFRGRVTGALLVRNFIAFGSALVRKECFERLGGFREELPMGIDYDLWLRFSTLYEFDFVDAPLLRYRLWTGQMSNDCRSRYAWGMRIMEDFLLRFPGTVDSSTQREAWAHTYTGLGACLNERERTVLPSMIAYARALAHKPTYLPAWRGVASTLLAR